MKVRFHYNIDKFRLKGTKKVRNIATKIVKDAGLRGGLCEIIFTTDNELVKINKEFLDSDFYTDVISFSNNEGKEVSGEIYVSIDTVRRNAEDLGVSLKSETYRVIFHGMLHLCGYNDHTKVEREEMFDMEELYLALAEAE